MNELPYYPQLDEKIIPIGYERIKRIKRDFDEYQLPFQFNTIIVDKGLMLAPNGKYVKKEIKTDNIDYLINTLLDEFKDRSGLKRFRRDTYSTALNMLLANARIASERHAQVVIGRRKDKYKYNNPKSIDPRTTNAILDFMADQNLIAYIHGKDNEMHENSSWFMPLPRLVNMLKHAEVMGTNIGHIVLHNEHKMITQWSKMRSVQLAVTRMEKEMNAYCTLLFEHDIRVMDIKLIPFAKRVFNRKHTLGGRIYADWELLSKGERAQIKIDGEKTVELDYSTIHYRILYAQEGATLTGDPYIVDGYDRDTIKRVSLVMLNSESLVSLCRQITRSGNPEIKAMFSSYRQKRETYVNLKSRGLAVEQPYKPKALDGFIEGIPDGTQGKPLLAMLMQRHDPIAHRLGTPDIGISLQFADSQVMMQCVNEATALGIPVLPVHDSLICQARHKGLIYGIMREAFKAQYGQEIEVKT